jgi:hypothetical protein
MKKITKKQSKEFNSKVNSLLLEKGFKFLEDDGRCLSYEIDTQLSKYVIHLYPQDGTIYSIFGRFDNPNEAKNSVECNPFTGKYNFHSIDGDECYKDFARFLNWLGVWNNIGAI